MSAPTPPAVVLLDWCPECGRSDRFEVLGPAHNSLDGTICAGVPVCVRYESPTRFWDAFDK